MQRKKIKLEISAYLVLIGKNHFHFDLPKTWTQLLYFPKLKPFLSGPNLNTGALKDSRVDRL